MNVRMAFLTRRILGCKNWAAICQSNLISSEPPIPLYVYKEGEPSKARRSRLVYQSRKRGMLENDLILSTFADKHLNGMTEDLVEQYDRLINLPSNDWEIYYWATGTRPVPKEFDNEVMEMLKTHVQNRNKEERIRQPDLQEKEI